MLRESVQASLIVDEVRVAQMLGTTSADGMIYSSLRDAWMLLEPLPHRYFDFKDVKRKWKLPMGELRWVLEGAPLHESVWQRMALGSGMRLRTCRRSVARSLGCGGQSPRKASSGEMRAARRAGR